MKKSIIIIVALSMVIAVFGLVSIVGRNSSSEAINLIGTERAKDVAFKDSGYSQSDAREISVEYERAHGREIYEVEFEINGLDFDYYIDAYTGAIIESKVPSVKDQATAMANNNQSTNQADQTTQSGQQTAEEQNTQTGTNQTVQTGNHETDAHHTDTHHSNQSSTQQNNQTAQTNTQQNSQTSQTNTQQNTGTQQNSQTNQTNQTGTQQNTQTNQTNTQLNTQTGSGTPSGIISEARAKELVLSRVPGATAANFTKFHLDFDDGRYEYEGELIFNEMEYDFEIDAYSGSFRDWDAESIYD